MNWNLWEHEKNRIPTIPEKPIVEDGTLEDDLKRARFYDQYVAL